MIISPLKTFVEDKVSSFKSLGLPAIALHDEQSKEKLKEVEKGAFTYVFAFPQKICKLLLMVFEPVLNGVLTCR